MTAPCITFLCPRCRKTSVADRDEEGFPICSHCEPENAAKMIMDLHDRTMAKLRTWVGR